MKIYSGSEAIVSMRNSDEVIAMLPCDCLRYYKLHSEGITILTIQAVSLRKFGEEDMVAITFKECPTLPWGIKITVIKQIESYLGSKNKKDWIGKELPLCIQNVSSPNGVVPAIRVSVGYKTIQKDKDIELACDKMSKAKDINALARIFEELPEEMLSSPKIISIKDEMKKKLSINTK